jgi:hypothetical protein
MDPAKQEQQAPDEQPQDLSQILEDTYDELDREDDEVTDVDESAEEEEAEEVEEETAEAEEPGEAEIEEPGEEEGELSAGDDTPVEWDEPAPERWPAEMKEAYSKLPPHARQMMIEQVFKPMQRQYTQTTQELSQMRATLDPMLQTMQQHGGEIQQMGLDAPEAFRRQMAWASHFARVGPEQGVKDMSDAYGIQQGQQQGQVSDEYMTPVERSLKDQMNRMEQHLGQNQQQQTSYEQQQTQQATQARAQSIASELQTFVAEVKDGKPAHPHVDKVGHAMAGLIRGGLVEKFDEYGSSVPLKAQINQAYSLACQMDPSIRSVSPGKRNAGQVDRAKRANASVVSKAPGGRGDSPDRPIGDDISDIWDQLNRKAG